MLGRSRVAAQARLSSAHLKFILRAYRAGSGLTSLREQNFDLASSSSLNANLFSVCIAVYWAPNSFVLTKENKSMPLDFQVEASVRRNILEHLVRVLRRGRQSLIRDDLLREEAGGRLSEMIHFGKRLVVAYPR